MLVRDSGTPLFALVHRPAGPCIPVIMTSPLVRHYHQSNLNPRLPRLPGESRLSGCFQVNPHASLCSAKNYKTGGCHPIPPSMPQLALHVISAPVINFRAPHRTHLRRCGHQIAQEHSEKTICRFSRMSMCAIGEKRFKVRLVL